MAQMAMAGGFGLQILKRSSEISVAVGVVVVLAVMMVPIPTFLLDLLLSFSITFSLVILLVSIFMLTPLEFSVFPSLLLIVTLLRLSLNVASTRIILLHGKEGTGAAGHVIQAFGTFVVGGNYVVGTIVFIILSIINFIVITKGTVRTSEVAARFTLDAIPGKQMSIDADLNAGLINEQDARKRRQTLEREADFYGSMDGAIRFVRGDAIAAIMIAIINILGGFAIGVFQQHMAMAEAAKVYTLLSIGDGLVAQLPALVVSTAAGLVVTRAVSDKNLPTELMGQLLNHPRAFVIASAVLFFFGVIPNMPHFPFFLLSAISGIMAYYRFEAIKENVLVEKKKHEDEAKAPVAEKVESILPLDIMELEVGYELIPMVDAERNGELLERIKSIRRQFALEMGFIVPPLHIRDNLQLKPSEYTILIKGVQVTKGSVMMGRFLAMNPGTVEREMEGIKTVEPTYGLPAVWVTANMKQDAQLAGYTVVDPATVITTHIKETIRRHAYELLGRQEVQTLIDKFKESNPKVVEELIPAVLTLGKVQKVLQNLLKENISIRDLRSILEQLADYAPLSKDADVLTEYVRQALARSITKQYQAPDGSVGEFTLEKSMEDIIEGAVQRTDVGSYLALEPTVAERIITKVKNVVEASASLLEGSPILLVSPTTRMYIRRLMERFLPDLVILSHNEIVATAKIKTLKVVGLNAN